MMPSTRMVVPLMLLKMARVGYMGAPLILAVKLVPVNHVFDSEIFLHHFSRQDGHVFSKQDQKNQGTCDDNKCAIDSVLEGEIKKHGSALFLVGIAVGFLSP